MSYRAIPLLLAALFGLALSNVRAEESGAVDLFIGGCHLDTPIPKAEWYGLYLSNSANESRLSRVSIKTVKRRSGVDDLFEYCIKTTPISKDISANYGPIVLLAGKIISEGPLNKATIAKSEFTELKGKTYSGSEAIPATDEDIELVLNQKHYLLHQRTNLDDNAEGDNHILTLSLKGHKQTILSVHGNYEGATRLKILWAGDIDNDGNLDLILNAPESYAQQYDLRIYLSSMARGNDLVFQAGERGFDGI